MEDNEPRQGAFLLLSLYIPDIVKGEVDPDDIAEALISIVNEERRNNAGIDSDKIDHTIDIGIGLFPAVQWLTPEVYRELSDLAREMRLRVRPGMMAD